LTQLGVCNAFSLPSLEGVARLKVARLQWFTLARLALVTTLDPLSSVTTLTHLHLSGCYAVGSLAPLRVLVDLQYLNLRDMGRAAASSLQFLTELTQLQNMCLTTTVSVIDGSHMHLRPLTYFLGDRIELHVFSGQAASSMAASLIDTHSANLKALWLVKSPPDPPWVLAGGLHSPVHSSCIVRRYRLEQARPYTVHACHASIAELQRACTAHWHLLPPSR
jgi:hypothetical protein